MYVSVQVFSVKEIISYREMIGVIRMNKVINKFLDIMKLSDDGEFDDEYDDDYLDDGYDDEYDDYEEKSSSKFKFGKKKNTYDDYEEESSSKATYNKNNKITQMRQPSSSKPSSGSGVCVIKPTSIDDGREISDKLLDGRTVILNLEGQDIEVAQSIIYFTSGATYAIKGNLQKISNYIFLITPYGVDISGDINEIIGNSFDMSSMRSRF